MHTSIHTLVGKLEQTEATRFTIVLSALNNYKCNTGTTFCLVVHGYKIVCRYVTAGTLGFSENSRHTQQTHAHTHIIERQRDTLCLLGGARLNEDFDIANS